MMKLKRLKIHKCRSVKPGTELEFNDGLNIVLGKNGAGKTTLLKLVAAAVGSSFADEFHDDDLHVEYEYILDDIRIHCLIIDQERGEAITGQGIRSRTRTFHATFLSTDLPPITTRLVGDAIFINSEGHEHRFDLNAGVSTRFDAVALIGTFLGHLVDPPASVLRPFIRLDSKLTHRMDEGLDWLRQTLDKLAINFLSLVADEDWCTTNSGYTGVAPDFRAAFGEHRHHFKDLPEILAVHAGTLPLLRRACEHIGLNDISWTLSFIEHTRGRFEVKRYGRSQIFITTHGGTRFPLEKLSFGQLRLFAFFLHSAMHPHVVVADELTNGLHHEMVDSCLDTIGERQAFLATQNPLLLDHIGFDDAEEVRRTFILCDLQGETDGEKSMRWRNMSAEEAHEFYADYKVGIQHVNDILRKRGLW